MFVRATPEMMSAAERSFARAFDQMTLNGLTVPSKSPFVRVLYITSEAAVWFRSNPLRGELLSAASAHHGLDLEGHARLITGVLEKTREKEVARYQVTSAELYESLFGAILALHGYWRRVGYPEDYVEAHLLIAMSLFRIPHDQGVATMMEVLRIRETNAA